MYGEYAAARGQAVRRFHEKLAEVDARHKKEHPDRPAHYTIIAHSLGTMMAMDALFYAHAKSDVRITPGAGQGVPFPGYCQCVAPEVNWIDRVDGLVTLGSPIDKFLGIWWLNYLHLNDTKPWLGRVKKKIEHFNYCEVQDPVGQHMHLVKNTAAYKHVFDLHDDNDRIYMRYAWPGVAHVAYWNDRDFFDGYSTTRSIHSRKAGRAEKAETAERAGVV